MRLRIEFVVRLIKISACFVLHNAFIISQNKQSCMGIEKEMDKIKQSSMGNRERVKAFKHGGIVKEKGLWRGVTGVKN